MIWLLRSNLRIFLLRKLCIVWVYLYWSSRGCNLAAHSSIHASFILRRGLTRIQLPKIQPYNHTYHTPSLLVHHSSLHHHSLGSIHLKLLSCWVESTHLFVARAVDSLPSVLLHPSGGHYCWTRCRLQMFWKPQVCVEYGNRTRQHQSGHQSNYWLCLTSVIYLIVPQMKVALWFKHAALKLGTHLKLKKTTFIQVLTCYDFMIAGND